MGQLNAVRRTANVKTREVEHLMVKLSGDDEISEEKAGKIVEALRDLTDSTTSLHRIEGSNISVTVPGGYYVHRKTIIKAMADFGLRLVSMEQN